MKALEKRLKFYLENGQKMIKQEAEQLKVNQPPLRRTRTSLLTHKNVSQACFILISLLAHFSIKQLANVF